MAKNAGHLKPTAPYVVGQIVGYVERAAPVCVVLGVWHVIATELSQERLASKEIAARGLVAYLPTLGMIERHGGDRMRGVERPMFPGYLFARCEPRAEHWHLITNARGVRQLLQLDGKPVSVKDGHIEVVRLKEAEEAERFGRSQLARKRGRSGIVWSFSAADKVRIKTGPFAGFFAELEAAVDAHDRVRALVSIFGRPTRSEFSAFDIEAS